MTFLSAVVVYVCIWWVVMFCVLPIGIERADEAHLGHDAGAPVNPRIGRKMAIATGIATILFLIAYAIIRSDLISFRPHH